MKTLLWKATFTSLLFGWIIVSNAQPVSFEYIEIGTTERDRLNQNSLVDLDKDGDLDYIVGASADKIWWFENTGKRQWKMHQLGDNALTDRGGVAVDINGDGWIDQVSGGSYYLNSGKVPISFDRFENGGIYAYDNIAADVNNDGVPEIISTSEQDGTVLYFFAEKPGKKWKSISIDDGVSGGMWPKGYGDIDGDGDIDLVRSNVWYENVKGDGTKWEVKRTLTFVESQGKYANTSRSYVVDMDGDGDMDVIQSDAHNPNGSVAWHENKNGRGTNWYLHPIGTETEQDLHSLAVADYDNDGDMDVICGGGPMKKDLYERVFLFTNVDGSGEKWTKTEILFDKEMIDPVCGDVDGDGDIDIIGKPWKGNTIFLLENQLIK